MHFLVNLNSTLKMSVNICLSLCILVALMSIYIYISLQESRTEPWLLVFNNLQIGKIHFLLLHPNCVHTQRLSWLSFLILISLQKTIHYKLTVHSYIYMLCIVLWSILHRFNDAQSHILMFRNYVCSQFDAGSSYLLSGSCISVCVLVSFKRIT